MLGIKKLNISFERKILEDVCFRCYGSSLNVIKGESGSGKTTLLYRIALLSHQNDYDYFIDNYNIGDSSTVYKSNLRKYNISYVLQDSLLLSYYDVQGNLKHYARMADKNLTNGNICEVLNDVGLNIPLDREIDTLSGGERQRLAIACALVRDSEIIILDEPTNSLDLEHEKNIFELLRDLAHKKSKCIIISSHSSLVKDYADSIYEINDKKLICVKENVSQELLGIEYRNKKMKIEFLFQYVKYYMKIFKKQELARISVIIISFLLILASILGIDYFQQEGSQKILSNSDNQLYISSKENGEFVNENSQVIPNINSQIKKGNIKVYPYIFATVEILGKEIDIIPYFVENDFKDNYLYKYLSLDDGPILNYETYQLFKRNYMTSQFIDTTITVKVNNGNGGDDKEYKINKDVKGVLKEGVRNSYTKNNYFIYFPYEWLVQLYPDNNDYQEFVGYTLFSKDFDSHIQLVNELKEKDISVNDQFQNTQGLIDIVDSANHLKLLLLTIILIGSLFSIAFMLIYGFGARKKEFALTMIAGFSYKEIMKISVIESIVQNLISFLFFIPITVIAGLIFQVEILKLLQLIGMITVEMVMIIVIIFIFNYMQIRKISVEDILRK